jgi:cyanophycinase
MQNSPGALALVGSGEYLPDLAHIEGALLDDGVNRGRRRLFVQIPTAAGRESSERLAYWERLGKEQAQRLESEWFSVPVHGEKEMQAPASEWSAAIAEAGLIYFSGGDPGHLVRTWRGSELWSAVEIAWRNGASLAGCSAGAMALCGDVLDVRHPRRRTIAGFGLVPGTRVLPHFDRYFGHLPGLVSRPLMKGPDGITVVGIHERTALVYGLSTVPTQGWSVLGHGSVEVLGSAARLFGPGEVVPISTPT